MKKFLLILTIICLCILVTLSSLTLSNAVSKPGKLKGFKITSYNSVYDTVTVKLKEKKSLNYEIKVYNYKNKPLRAVKVPIYNPLTTKNIFHTQ